MELVFGKGRRTTHAQLVRTELGESFDHLRQAAAHAATGVGEKVGPRAADGVHRMKDFSYSIGTQTPLVKNSLRKKEPRMSRKRWPMLAGLLAAGAALGAAGALVMRRRKQQQWQEYDPTQAIEPTQADFDKATLAPADPVTTDDFTPEPADHRP
ncbi:hypothetical protein WEI85_04015 [Actinomycetes bacterium KLBMP 9797]